MAWTKKTLIFHVNCFWLLVAGGLFGIIALIGLGIIAPLQDQALDKLKQEVDTSQSELTKHTASFEEFLRLKDNEQNLVTSLTVLHALPDGLERQKAIARLENSLSLYRDTLLKHSASLANQNLDKSTLDLEFSDKQEKTIELINLFEEKNKSVNRELADSKKLLLNKKKVRNRWYIFFILLQVLILSSLSLAGIFEHKEEKCELKTT